MQIEITKQVQQTEIIEIDLPYYYKHNLNPDYHDSIIYGKIDENEHICIQESEPFNTDGEFKYEIEKQTHFSIKDSGLGTYFNKTYNSNKEEFEKVKQRCLSFLSENF